MTTETFGTILGLLDSTDVVPMMALARAQAPPWGCFEGNCTCSCPVSNGRDTDSEFTSCGVVYMTFMNNEDEG